MRITTGMIANQYNKGLNRALYLLNQSSLRSITYRKFNSASEDPLAAAKAFRIRNEFDEGTTHQSNAKDIKSRMVTAESSLMTINSMIQEANSGDCLQAVNGTMQPSDRTAIASKLRKVQDAILSTINTKFGDQYIFGGSYKNEAPFTVENGELYYQNINVNTGLYKEVPGEEAITNIEGMKIHFGSQNGDMLNGYTLVVQKDSSVTTLNPAILDNTSKTITVSLNDKATNAELQTALQGMSNAPAGIDLSAITVDNPASFIRSGKSYIDGGSNGIPAGTPGDLGLLSNETDYIDIGLGLNFKNGKIVEQSVYDAAMPGIKYLGFGVSDDGVPNNFYSLLGEISDALESQSFVYEDVKLHLNNFDKKYEEFLTNITEFGSKTHLLDNTISRLEDLEYNLNQKADETELIDPTTAIMEYKLQEYSYNAALQMGVNLLQPSLLDYLR